MIVHMKRAVSDERSRFIVYNEKGDLLYRIKGRYSGAIEKLSVIQDNNKIASIVEIAAPLGVLRAYRITHGCEGFNIIITKTKNTFVINFFGISFMIQGDIINRRYSIIDIDGTVQAEIREDFVRRCTDINIINENRSVFCIAIAACISSIGFINEYKMQKA